MNYIRNIFKKKYDLTEVFTPTTAAKLTFVKRPTLEIEFTKYVKMPGMQIVIYGNSGGGKTTLIINKLEELKINYIITNCISSTTVDDIILQAFDTLNSFYTSEKEYSSSINISSELKAKYKFIESSINSEMNNQYSEKKERIVPVQLTPKRLAEFLGAVKCVWIIEDFHKVSQSEKKKLSQIMKVFYDMANHFDQVKIIAIGAMGTAREVVNYDKELNNRVAEIFVPLLKNTELEEILIRGSELLNVSISKDSMTKIVKYSNHLASICHQLAFNMCYDKNIYRTSIKKIKLEYDDLEKAVKSYVEQKSDSFKQLYDKAVRQRKGKFENVKLIFKAFLSIEKDEVTYNEILMKIREIEPNYPQSNLTVYLKPLTTPEYGEIIRYDSNSNKYSFSDPFVKTYIMLSLEIEEKEKEKKKNDYQSDWFIDLKFDNDLNDIIIITKELINNEKIIKIKELSKAK